MVAVLLGATTGMAYLSHGESTPPAKPLTQFPDQIGPYSKVIEWPLDKETLDILKLSDYLNRGYWTPGMNRDLLGLYVGYFRSQRTGATIHSPKNCLPGAGWNPVQATIYQIAAGRWRARFRSTCISCAKLRTRVVLYWYQSHGRIVASDTGASSI